jgi:hypothetical protein
VVEKVGSWVVLRVGSPEVEKVGFPEVEKVGSRVKVVVFSEALEVEALTVARKEFFHINPKD